MRALMVIMVYFSDWPTASLLVKLFLKFGDVLRSIEFVCACVGVG